MSKERYAFKTQDSEGKEIELYFIPETYDVRKKCDLAYAKAYAYYLKEGCLTNSQTARQLTENGVLSPDHDNKIQQCNLKIVEHLSEMGKINEKKRKTKKDKDRFQELKTLIKEQRETIQKLSLPLVEATNNTCESKAHDRKIEIAVVYRLVDKDDNYIFGDHEEYVQKIDETMAQDAYEHMLYLDAGIPFRMDGAYPEDLVSLG